MSCMGRVKLAGRHVLITGGSTGIGLAVARACMLQNATVTLVARTQSKLEAAQKELQGLADSKQITANIYFQSADVTCEEQVWRSSHFRHIPESCCKQHAEGQ